MSTLDRFKVHLDQAIAEGAPVINVLCADVDSENELDAIGMIVSAARSLPSVQHITLSMGEIGPRGLLALAQAADVFQDVNGITLSEISIGDEAAHALGALIRECPSLRRLCLMYAGLSEMSVGGLKALSQTFKTLEELAILFDSFGDRGLRALLAGSEAWSRLRLLEIYECDITSNGIRSLGRSAKHLKALEAIDVSANDIGDAGCKELAVCVRELPRLRRLRLAMCNINHRGVSALLGCDRGLAALCELDLSGNDLGYLGAQSIASYSKDLVSLRTLKISDATLGGNALECVLGCLKNWPHLAELDLNGHTIGKVSMRRLGESLGCLQELGILDLTSCRIDSETMAVLASSVTADLSVKEIRLSYNNLGVNGVREFSKLRERCPHLQVIEMRSSGLQADGVQLLLDHARREPWLSTVQSIDLSGNGITTYLDECDADPRIVCSDTIKEREARRRQEWPEVSVILLGEGRVGKTHLRKRVLGGDASYFHRAERSTHNIETRDCQASYVKVRVRDCGGQSSAPGVHGMYLSGRRSVAVVVCDATQTREANRLDDWLRMIRYQASAVCPVIVVITKCDSHDEKAGSRRRLEPLEIEDLRSVAGLEASRSLQIIDGMGWSDGLSKERAGATWKRHCAAVDEFESAVVRALHSVPEINEEYPPSLIEILQWVEERGFLNLRGQPTAYVSVGRFHEACRACKVPDSQITSVLETANALGLIQYYGSLACVSRADLIADTVFNPEWIRYPIYRLIREARDYATNGVLTWETIDTILPEHSGAPEANSVWERVPFTAKDRAMVVRVMVVSDLMYEVRSAASEVRYLLPDLLDRRGMTAAPTGDHVWMREFEWLPEAVMGKLVGRLQQQAHGNRSRLWKDEIELDAGDGRTVTVRAMAADTKSSLPERRRSRTVLWAALSHCAAAEAARLLGVIDIELRIILDERVLDESKWVRVGNQDRGSEAERERPYPDFARHAVLLHTTVSDVVRRGGANVRDYPELLSCAERILEAQGGRLGNPELAAAIRWARANPERLPDYVRRARLNAWWTGRGKRGVARPPARNPDREDDHTE